MKNTLLLVALMLASCMSTDSPSRPTESSKSSPTGMVAELYDLVTFDAGTTPDWNAVRALFVEEAIIVLRTGRNEMSIFSLDDFVNDFVQFIEQAGVEATGFTERVLDMKEFSYGDIAHVLVLFDSHISGSDRAPREGIDSFELIRRDGDWRIVSIINERPTSERPIPGDQFD